MAEHGRSSLPVTTIYDLGWSKVEEDYPLETCTLAADLDISRTRHVGAADEPQSHKLTLALNGSHQYPLADLTITNIPRYVSACPVCRCVMYKYSITGTPEPAFRLGNRMFITPERFLPKSTGPGTAFRCVPPYFNHCTWHVNLP